MAMSGFGSAFAAARKAGKKQFTWNGKEYNTELKGTDRPKPRGKSSKASSEMSPKARPKKSSTMSPKARPKAATSKSSKGVVKPEPGWMEKKLGKMIGLKGR